MAIVTIRASKATPTKALAYITEKGKAALITYLHLDTSQDPAQQMMTTARLWGKAQEETDRKYYHIKIAFAPEDWVENGGTLTEKEAQSIGMAIMKEFFPDHESVGSTHRDKHHLHFHGLVNAVNLETGKMLDMRNYEYARLKDRVQEVCAERGLNAIDWRQATKEKRAKEKQAADPVKEDTFAEQGLKQRGEIPWKDQLRSIVDHAAKTCSSMEEFQAVLESLGVTLTRNSEMTISYKYGDHRACRGDTLGGDYTAQAIRDALQHNADQEEHDATSTFSLGDRIAGIEARADYKRVITAEEREIYRDLGRQAGFKRADIDALCDQAPRATWEEKKAAWSQYKAAKAEFWDAYAIRQRALQNEINAAYKRRRRVKNAEWALNPKNRRASLFGMVYAAIVLSRNDSVYAIDGDIKRLKEQQQRLRSQISSFKRESGEALDTLREKGLSLDEYMETVLQMQNIADQIQKKNAAMLDAAEIDKLRRQADRDKAKRQKEYERNFD